MQSRRRTGTAQKPAATNGRTFHTFLLMAQLEAREIGQRIRQKRKETGMTQEDLAMMASFSKRSLQDYESGATIPYRHLAEIGKLLNTDPSWFLYGPQEEKSASDQPSAALEQQVADGLAAANRIQELLEELLRRLPDAPESSAGSH